MPIYLIVFIGASSAVVVVWSLRTHYHQRGALL
jgi:hypothetical protein